MTISSKILSDQYKQSGGFSPAPTDIKDDNTKVVSGAGSDTKSVRDHRDLGQLIRKGVELITRSTTSVYQTVGDIDPGRTSSYVIRALGPELSISLANSPSVPESQRTLLGAKRERFWEVEVMIYYAVECTVTWPQNIISGRAGYRLIDEIESSTGVSSLEELPGPAVNERRAGTADFYRLTYIERTGQWVVDPVALGIASADPETPADDATDDVEEGDNEDEGEDATLPPEDDYVDEDGNTLTPQLPPSSSSNLITFHESVVSISANGGSNWSLHGSPIQNPLSVAYNPTAGIAVASGDNFYASKNAKSWNNLAVSIESSELEDLIEIPNGNFETGKLAPWQLVSGDEPRVLNSKSNPPQKPGSTHYLARDWRIINNQDFEVQQTVSIPNDIQIEDILVSADVYVEDHATATLRVSKGHLSGSPEALQFQIAEGGVGTSSTAPFSHDYSIRFTCVDLNAQSVEFTNGLNTQAGDHPILVDFVSSGFAEFQVDLIDSIGVVSSKPFSIVINDIDKQEKIKIYDGYTSVRVPQASAVDISAQGDDIIVSRSGDQEHPSLLGSVIIDAKGGFRFRYSSSSTAKAFNVRGVEEVDVITDEVSVSNSKKGEWHTISAELTGYLSHPVDIILKGEGDPADVVFDNVRITAPAYQEDIALSVTSGVRDNLIGGLFAFYKFRKGEPEFVSRIELPASSIGAVTSLIATHDIATGGFLTSSDYGQTWKKLDVTKLLRGNIVSGDRLVCITADGLYQITHNDVILKKSGSTFHDVTWDPKRQQWYAVFSDGSVRASQDLEVWEYIGSQPIHPDIVNRRIYATESGRMFGWSKEKNVLFWSDDAKNWRVGPNLQSEIRHLRELA